MEMRTSFQLCLTLVTLQQQCFLTGKILNLCPFKLIKAAPVSLKRKIRANIFKSLIHSEIFSFILYIIFIVSHTHGYKYPS